MQNLVKMQNSENAKNLVQMQNLVKMQKCLVCIAQKTLDKLRRVHLLDAAGQEEV